MVAPSAAPPVKLVASCLLPVRTSLSKVHRMSTRTKNFALGTRNATHSRLDVLEAGR